ncbi:MAG: hypothetical protein PHQ23_15205 [Candidatus Wallbacteria bacterium]|nr:hypothetical protein [Candidatus Wallbacteria bacterium]
MKILNRLKNHRVFFAALVVSIALIAMSLPYQSYLDRFNQDRTELVQKLYSSVAKDTLEVSGGNIAFLTEAELKKRRKALENEAMFTPAPPETSAKIVQPKPSPGQTERYQSVSPALRRPVVFQAERQHKNLFLPYYLSNRETKKTVSASSSQIPVFYKGYYNAGSDRVAIFKKEQVLVYAKKGQLLGDSDYKVSEIEFKWVRLVNIYNNEQTVLTLGGETR